MFIILHLNIFLNTMRALSKEDLKPSRENMRGAASLWKKRQTLSLPPTCTQLVLCEKGKFSLDGSFSKNAPYKQKIIFHLTSIGKMSRKFFFCLGRQGGGISSYTTSAGYIVCSPDMHAETRKSLFRCMCLLKEVVQEKSEFDLVRFPGISGHFRLVCHKSAQKSQVDAFLTKNANLNE